MADSLFRISLKCIITNERGEILFIKEAGRSNWDLPGGGMELGETIKEAAGRELKEEISLSTDFNYTLLTAIDPSKLITRDVWQMKLLLNVIPEQQEFSVGIDADDIAFISLDTLSQSKNDAERTLCELLNSISTG